jgi:hypothetical protein
MMGYILPVLAIAAAIAVAGSMLWARRLLTGDTSKHRDAWKREMVRASKAEERLRELEEVILVQAEAIKRRRQTADAVRCTEQLLDPPSPAKRVQRGDCPQA